MQFGYIRWLLVMVLFLSGLIGCVKVENDIPSAGNSAEGPAPKNLGAALSQQVTGAHRQDSDGIVVEHRLPLRRFESFLWPQSEPQLPRLSAELRKPPRRLQSFPRLLS